MTSGTAPELVRFDTASPGTLTRQVAADRPARGRIVARARHAPRVRRAVGVHEHRAHAARRRRQRRDAPGRRAAGRRADLARPAGRDRLQPAVDRLRFVSTAEDNLRVNPLTFLPVDSDANSANGTQPDTDLAFNGARPERRPEPVRRRLGLHQQRQRREHADDALGARQLARHPRPPGRRQRQRRGRPGRREPQRRPADDDRLARPRHHRRVDGRRPRPVARRQRGACGASAGQRSARPSLSVDQPHERRRDDSPGDRRQAAGRQ